MRFVRVLLHLGLALALLGAPIASARVIGLAPAGTGAQQHHGGDGHGSAGAHAGPAGCHDAASAAGNAADEPAGCSTACCFVQSGLPLPAVAGIVVPFAAIHYAEVAWPASGLVHSPEPGIPKPIV